MMTGKFGGPILAPARWHMPWRLFIAQQRHQYPCVADSGDGNGEIEPEVLEPYSIGSSISVVDPAYTDGPGKKLTTLILL